MVTLIVSHFSWIIGDIRPENFVFSSLENRWKLIDFSFSSSPLSPCLQEGPQPAPEMKPSFKTDVWQLGVFVVDCFYAINGLHDQSMYFFLIASNTLNF